MSRRLIRYDNNIFVIRTNVCLSHHFDKNDRRLQTEVKTNIHRELLLKQNTRYVQNKSDNQDQSDNHSNE